MSTRHPLTLTIVALALMVAAALPAAAQFNCIPSCDPTDSRALVIASGSTLVTLSDPVIDLQIQVPAGTASFEIGIFDGDANAPGDTGFVIFGSPLLASYWDTGNFLGPLQVPIPREFTYTLYADPEADGVAPGGEPGNEIDLGGTTGNSVLSTEMTNNDWCCDVLPGPSTDSSFLISTASGPNAMAPSGNYFYTLRIELTDEDDFVPPAGQPAIISHSFKVRTSAVATIEPFAQPFSYIARWGSPFGDAPIVYPDSSGADVFSFVFRDTPTTYSGDFSFFFSVAAARQELDLWDGDFDHGRYDCPVRNVPPNPACGVNDADTDDLDTPNTANNWPANPFPPWNTEDGSAEGVAAGTLANANLTGSPPDDTNPVTLIGASSGRFVQRSPSVEYDLIVPDGREFLNLNPSGNREWEQFIISSHPSCDATTSCVPDGNPGDRPGFPCSDACTSRPLPPGTYELRIRGVDMQNLNAVRLPERVVCSTANGAACDSLAPYLLGDTVFQDQRGGAGTIAGDGVQQNGEPGINGVLVNLYNGEGAYAGTTITANDGVADGRYSFGVVADDYTVEVADENFVAPADGPVGRVGDRVWYDFDEDGIQDAGEPGIVNVRLRLWDDGGDGVGGGNDEIIASTTTDRLGEYLFTGLADGTYFVTVDESSLPGGLAFTGGTGVVGGAPGGAPVVATISGGNQVLTLDFGYDLADGDDAWVGDAVWSDADGDGVQDADEAGIAGVTLELCIPDCDTPVNTTSTVTAADGSYHFLLTPPAADTGYEVRVTDANGVLLGYAQTGDPDQPGVPCTTCDGAQSLTLSPGDAVPTVDFGYRNTDLADISDKIWLDERRNGAFDAGDDPALAGVTVSLLRGSLVIATTVTDADGNFTFADLPDGDYRVVITDLGLELNGLLATTPAALADGLDVVIAGTGNVDGKSFGYSGSGALEGREGTTFWDPAPDDPDDQTRTVPLIVGGEEENNLLYDFGYVGTGTLGDQVWVDNDRDGLFEPNLGELPLAGVKVDLYDGNGDLVETATTDANGEYLFERLPADLYTVVVQDGNFDFGQPLYGYSQVWDPDDDGIFDNRTERDLEPFEEYLLADFGYLLDNRPGTGTPGYWKNHPEDWPVDEILLGDETYTLFQALGILNHPDDGEGKQKEYTLGRALISAKLNAFNGNDTTCISDVIAAADAWLIEWVGRIGSGHHINANSKAWGIGEPLYWALDDYNNGRLDCADHR